MNTRKTRLVAIIIVVLLILIPSSLFTVQEGQQGLKLRLSQLVKNSKTGQVAVYQPGLHFKFPLIDQVDTFDTRIQTIEVPANVILTVEKKRVVVDYYIKWHISDLPLYYQRTGGDIQRASVLLKQQAIGALLGEFNRRTIREVVSDERDQIMTDLHKKLNQGTKPLGIAVLDFRIMQIEFPASVADSVYENMRTERQQVANEFRSKGRAKAEAIKAAADAEVTVMIAQAQLDANDIRAKGDMKAAQTYSAAYSQNPEFYAFLRSLQAYSQTFTNKDDILVLSPDSQFFRYFNNPGATASAEKG